MTTENPGRTRIVYYARVTNSAVASSPRAMRRTGVMREGKVQAQPGTGRFLARGPYDMIRPRGVLADGFDAAPAPRR